MADYTTKGSFNLGNQIALKNKNSNIDRDYGPYEGKTLTEIAALLTDTIQIGKTIGVVENGRVVEYWWQQNGFVKKVSDVSIVDHKTASSVEIRSNVLNVWGEVTSLKITKGAEIGGIVNNYMIRFTAGASGTDMDVQFIDFAIQWYGGSQPDWVAGNTYEISIVDDIALWAEFEPNA